MILITGGVASGKRTYARRTLGYTDEQMADAVLDARPVLYNLQNLVARAPENAQGLFDALREKDVVIVCEVGSGIVPDNLMARECRDLAGWVNQRVAAACDKVYLCVAGQAVDMKKLAFKFEDAEEYI